MKERLQKHLAAFDETFAYLAGAARMVALWSLGIVTALGSTVWALRHWNRLPALSKNGFTAPERWQLLGYVGGAALAWLLALGATAALHRRRSGSWQLVPAARELCRGTSFLMAGPLCVYLATPKIETQSTFLTFFFASAAALAFAPTLMALVPGATRSAAGQEAAPWRRRLDLAGRLLAPLALLGLVVAYAWFFSRLSITNHQALNTRTVDLGYYDNIFYQSAHGRPLACTFIRAEYHGSAHFDPILVLLAPLYRLYPRAEFLLILQSAWLALGAIPVYLFARRKLGSRPSGLVLAAAYLLSPAVHGANMYEFHSLTLLGTPLLFALYYLELEAPRRYFTALGLVLLVREDAALLACFLGAHALLTRRPRSVRYGWITIVVSLAYFALVKKFFMTSSDIFMGGKDAYSFAYYYRDLIPEGSGLGGFVTSILVNPAFALALAVREAKVEYLLTLFVPLAFLPLFAKPGRVMMIYGAVFLLLATREPVYSPHFQYSVVLLPIMLVLSPVGIARLEAGSAPGWLGVRPGQLRAGVLGLVLVASLLVSWKFGAIVENGEFRGGFSRITRKLSDKQREQYAGLRRLADQVPAGASLSVTNIVGPHLSNRARVYFYHQRKRTDYALIDERDMKPDVKGWHQRRVQRRELVQLDAAGTMKLFRFDPEREGAPEGDAEESPDVGREPAADAPAAAPSPPRPPRKSSKSDPTATSADDDADRLDPPEGWRDPEEDERLPH